MIFCLAILNWKLPETNSVILPRTMEQAEYIEDFAMRDFKKDAEDNKVESYRPNQEETIM